MSLLPDTQRRLLSEAVLNVDRFQFQSDALAS